jgi:hypothetical protein
LVAAVIRAGKQARASFAREANAEAQTYPALPDPVENEAETAACARAAKFPRRR